MTKQDVKLSGRELQQLYQSEVQTLQQVEQQRNTAIGMIADVEAARAALSTIKESPKDNPVVVPLGSGIFTEARIVDPGQVKVNLPGGVVVTHDVASALDRLNQRKEQLKKDADAMEKERQRIAKNVEEIAKIIRRGKEFALSELQKKLSSQQDADE